MGAKYTEAQKRAIQKYQKKFKRTALPLTDEQHEKYYAMAEEQGVSLTKLIIKLLDREYSRTHSENKSVTIKSELPTRITLSEEQIAALAYVRSLYGEFVSYLDFLWDWNWKSEGILNSFDSPEKTGAVNRRLEAVGISRIEGIVIDPDNVPKNNFNYSQAEAKKYHDEYLDIVLGMKKKFIKYFREIDALCGTDYSTEM